MCFYNILNHSVGWLLIIVNRRKQEIAIHYVYAPGLIIPTLLLRPSVSPNLSQLSSSASISIILMLWITLC